MVSFLQKQRIRKIEIFLYLYFLSIPVLGIVLDLVTGPVAYDSPSTLFYLVYSLPVWVFSELVVNRLEAIWPWLPTLVALLFLLVLTRGGFYLLDKKKTSNDS